MNQVFETETFSKLYEASEKREQIWIDKMRDQISENLDHLKYFLTILWELKGIDNNKFSSLGTQLASIGKQIGGLLKAIK